MGIINKVETVGGFIIMRYNGYLDDFVAKKRQCAKNTVQNYKTKCIQNTY